MAEAGPDAAAGTRGTSGAECVPPPGAVINTDPGAEPSPTVAEGSSPVVGRAPSVAASLALVAAGGCTGTLVRAALERAWPAAPGHLPATTLALNVVGALALGTGVLGGLTTHSTFILESHRLLTSGGDAGHPVLGAVYLVGSMAAGLGAAGLGLWLAGQLHRQGRPDGSILPEVS